MTRVSISFFFSTIISFHFYSFYNVFTMIYTIELYRILKRNMILYRFSYKNKIFLDFLSFKFMKTVCFSLSLSIL